MVALLLSLNSPKPHQTILNPRYPAAQLSPALLDQVQHFTVLISNEGLGGVGRGTGVIINDHTVLSCAHMINTEGGDMLIYTYPIREVRKGTLKYFNEQNDLALFTLDRPVHLVHYPIFQPIVTEGEPITVVGNIIGCMKWFVSYGIISGRFMHYLLTDALTRGGNSGGPWVNNKGEVVALTDWGLQDRKGNDIGIHGGISAETIKTFLAESKKPNLFDVFISN